MSCYQLEQQLKTKEQECKNNKIAHQMELDIYNQECLNLLEELKVKEQECEELKKIINEAKNSKLDLNSFFAIEATVGEYQLELDQLKADRKEALEQLEFVRTLNTVKEAEIIKLSKTLTEITEIAEGLIKITCEFDDCYYKDECYKCGIKEDCQYIKVEQILQKISECEGNDD